MICKDCKYFWSFQNTDECGLGVCTLKTEYTQTFINEQCPYTIEPYKCKDCERFGNDYACFTADAEDEADNCCGFIDPKESQVVDAMFHWFLRGENIEEKLKDIYDKYYNTFKKPELREQN